MFHFTGQLLPKNRHLSTNSIHDENTFRLQGEPLSLCNPESDRKGSVPDKEQ